MSNHSKQQSPLVEIAVSKSVVEEKTIRIVEKAFWRHTVLRGLSTDQAFMAAVKSILDIDLPTKPNCVVRNNDLSVLWMSPDQWLLLSDDKKFNSKMAMLTGALEHVYASVNDVSDGQTIINIAGQNALTVMNKGTTFDVHPVVFGPGQCAQTIFAKMNVLIIPQHTAGHCEFDLIVRRSFADFLGRWLVNACTEFKESI